MSGHPIFGQEQQLGVSSESGLSSGSWLFDPISTSDTPPGAEGSAMAANLGQDSCGLPFTLLIRATAPLTFLVLLAEWLLFEFVLCFDDSSVLCFDDSRVVAPPFDALASGVRRPPCWRIRRTLSPSSIPISVYACSHCSGFVNAFVSRSAACAFVWQSTRLNVLSLYHP